MLLMLMMLPVPRDTMPGANAATRKNAALTLAANIASKEARAKVSVGLHIANPALLTRMSMSPTSLAKRPMLVASERSAATKRALPPCDWISSTVCAPRAASRPCTMTSAPSRAS